VDFVLNAMDIVELPLQRLDYRAERGAGKLAICA
jgi:hypothetical protein